MTVNIGDKPLAGFGEPLEMLKDCHRRIEHFLDVLGKVEQRYGESELDDEGRSALESALKYFADFAPRHTADEEQSLFPRMRSSDNPDVRAVMADLEGLEHDHRRCEESHAVVDRVGRCWLQTGRLNVAERGQLRAALAELTEVYSAHIQLEEQHVFAAASRILNHEQLRAIGQEMRQRRSLAPLADAAVGPAPTSPT